MLGHHDSPWYLVPAAMVARWCANATQSIGPCLTVESRHAPTARRAADRFGHGPGRVSGLRAPDQPRSRARGGQDRQTRPRRRSRPRSAAPARLGARAALHRGPRGARPATHDHPPRRQLRALDGHSRRRDRGRHAPRRRRHLPGHGLRRPLGGPSRLPAAHGQPGRAGQGPSLRGRRHQARAQRQGQRADPDLLVRRADHAHPGCHAGERPRGHRRRPDRRAPLPDGRADGLLPARQAGLRDGAGARARRSARRTRIRSSTARSVAGSTPSAGERGARTTPCRSSPASAAANASCSRATRSRR